MMAARRASRQAFHHFVFRLAHPFRFMTRRKDGMPMVSVSPMMATTIMISISVKPPLAACVRHGRSISSH